MRFVIQRVSEASVKVSGEVIGEIGKGFMVLIGVSAEDSEAEADRLVKRCWDFAYLRMKTVRPTCP